MWNFRKKLRDIKIQNFKGLKIFHLVTKKVQYKKSEKNFLKMLSVLIEVMLIKSMYLDMSLEVQQLYGGSQFYHSWYKWLRTQLEGVTHGNELFFFMIDTCNHKFCPVSGVGWMVWNAYDIILDLEFRYISIFCVQNNFFYGILEF